MTLKIADEQLCKHFAERIREEDVFLNHRYLKLVGSNLASLTNDFFYHFFLLSS